MSPNNPTQIARSPEKPESKLEEEEEEEEDDDYDNDNDDELEKLEAEVKQMAKKILEYRATLPDQLKTTVASLLSSQRPVLPHFNSGLDPGSSGELNPGQDNSSRTAEKVRLLKEKISSNVSAMPVVLKRLKDCISKIEKLDSCNGNIHPAFKKKKTS